MKKQITSTDLSEIRFLSNPRLGPDGKTALYMLTRTSDDMEGYDGTLVLLDTDTGAQCGTVTGRNPVSPAFAVDGSVWFGAKGNGKGSCLCHLVDGEVQERTTLDCRINKVMPIDAARVLLQVLTDENEKTDMQPCEMEVVDELPFLENGRGYMSKTRRRLAIWNDESKTLDFITEKLFEVATVRVDTATKTVIYTGNCFDEISLFFHGVYTYGYDTKETKELIAPGIYRAVDALMLNGDVIVPASQCKRYHLSENQVFYRMDGDTMTALDEPDLLVNSLGVGSDCKYGGGTLMKPHNGSIYFAAVSMERSNIYCLTPGSKTEKLCTQGISVDCFDVSDRGILFVGMKDAGLQELYLREQDGSVRTLTCHNDAYLESHDVVAPVACDFTNHNGDLVQGFVMRPTNWEEGKKYPAILDIHGGPKCAYGKVFYHEMQIWANKGYYVFYCNPRGSDGRGNVYGDLIERYGTVDYEDIMQFVDVVLERYQDIDVDRVGVTGGSYGGYMTNWLVGHTDRFKAAATQRSIASYLLDEGASDGGYYFMHNMYPPDPRQSFDKSWEQSPLSMAKNIKTPLLFIHSDEDFRCPLAGAMMLYTAIINNGCETKMVLFRKENHELSRGGRPYNRLKRLDAITEWMDQHLNA